MLTTPYPCAGAGQLTLTLLFASKCVVGVRMMPLVIDVAETVPAVRSVVANVAVQSGVLVNQN